MTNHLYYRLVKFCFAGIIILFICACSTNKKLGYINSGISKDILEAKAMSLYIDAKDNYDEPAKVSLLAEALFLYAKAGNIGHAEEIIEELEPKYNIILLEDREKIKLAKAYLHFFKESPSRSISILTNVNTRYLSLDNKRDFYSLKSQAYYKRNNPIMAAENLISLNRLLHKEEEIKLNNEKIWHILRDLTPDQLQAQVDNQTLSSELRGWINFNYVNKKYDIGQEEVKEGLKTWQQDYQNHAANEYLPTLTESDFANIAANKSRNLALLLPLSSGPYAKSANAVKNGFIVALYSFYKKDDNIPRIRIYDTSTENAVTQYHKAVANGADMVIGPLTKSNVEAISSIQLKVPVLALNVINTNNYYGKTKNLYEFGLLPEDEAFAVANRARFDGRENAAILVPNNDWGERVAKAFSEQWRLIGGKVVVKSYFSDDSLDSDVKILLGIDNSVKRANSVKSLGIRLQYTPRRRQDIDFVFVASNPATARQIKPLLNYYYAKELPVYATSRIYSGFASKRIDQDLNDIIFCDMPWILDDAIKTKRIYEVIKQKWPTELKHNPRLFAFGIDAYKLSQQLEQLKVLSRIGVSGMTGVLKLDGSNTIRRQLMWARFKNGQARLVVN